MPALFRPPIAVALACLLAALACRRGADEDSGPGQGRPADASMHGDSEQATLVPDRPFGADPVGWLDSRFEAELPRATVPDAAPLPWREVTPTRAVGDAVTAPAEPEWIDAAVVIGRRAAFVAGREVSQLRCRADSPDLCAKEALRAPTGKQRLEFASADALAPLTKAVEAAGWRGRPVWILADRRIDTGAVLAVQSAVRDAGAIAQLGVATLDGRIARLLPATEVSVTPPAAATAAASGEAVGPVPADLQAVTVAVSRRGVHLELRGAAATTTPELLGGVVEALSVWAERARAAAPHLHTAVVQASADAPWEETARAIDALRDTCARAAKGTPCHDRRALFGAIELAVAPAAPATPTSR